MDEAREQNRIAWEFDAYAFWVQRHGAPQAAAKECLDAPRTLLRKYAAYFCDVRGLRVANICGSCGRKAVPLAILGAEVTVFDISHENRRYACETAEAAGVPLSYVVGDVMEIDLARHGGAFDIVFAEGGVLHYFTDVPALLRVLHALLRPGGRLLLSDFHPLRKCLDIGDNIQPAPDMDYFHTDTYDTPMPHAAFYDEPERSAFPTCRIRRHTLSEIINAVLGAGLRLRQFDEHPAWTHPTFPGEFTLLAERPPAPESAFPVYDDYAFRIAARLSTDPALLSSPLGTRTAGSDAEHAAADFLAAEMRRLGLRDVEKVGVPVTRWQFSGASLALPDGLIIQLHAYATAATPPGGITAEILYLGKGTMWDYDGIDPTGKIILVDIDQRADWWVTYPMLEAWRRGAAALLAANVSGFAQAGGDALNANDICGPAVLPCASISVRDANRVKALLRGSSVTVTLCVDNIVEPGGTTYNVIGRIPGQNPQERILIGAHYDAYFHGFQDDSCGVGLVLAMAKSLLAAGYTPERDLVFCLHGAEEWGAAHSQFDWLTGAWRMIHEARPEWAQGTLAFLNFELPAYAFAPYTYVTSPPELYTLLRRYAAENPNASTPHSCFPEGVLTGGYPSNAYSDDFTYCLAGVPAMVNGFLRTADQTDVYPFYYERYHSQLDDLTTYNPDVMAFNLQFYTALAVSIDRAPAYLLDFRPQHDRLLAALDAGVFAQAGADEAGYRAALSALHSAAAAAYAAGEALNARYALAMAQGGPDATRAIWAEARAYNATVLAAFAQVQDTLMTLMYERPVVPHEAPQENIRRIQALLERLQSGDAEGAMRYAGLVNNSLAWCDQHFSPEAIDVVNAMLVGEEGSGNRFWGEGKMFRPADVSAVTRSLTAKIRAKTADFAPEIDAYQAALAQQAALIPDAVAREIEAIHALASILRRAAD